MPAGLSVVKLTSESENEMKPTRLLIEITLKENLDERWAVWFEGLTLTTLENGGTLLCGQVSDQAALHGFLEHIRDLNLKLSAVRVEEI
jgi:hypothetical protein